MKLVMLGRIVRHHSPPVLTAQAQPSIEDLIEAERQRKKGYVQPKPKPAAPPSEPPSETLPSNIDDVRQRVKRIQDRLDVRGPVSEEEQTFLKKWRGK